MALVSSGLLLWLGCRMELRDQIAIAAMNGLLSRNHINNEEDLEHCSVLSYALADAMLKARANTNTEVDKNDQQ